MGSARHAIAAAADILVALARSDQRTDDVETVASELIPLCDALAWIGRRGERLLADRPVGLKGRPAWMWGVHSLVRRVPWGRVLILGAWNYPILLSGVQAAQALAAGNTVLVKPAPGSEAVTTAWIDAFYRAGIPRNALRILDSSTAAATQAIDEGVDLVVLTGAASTGRKVLRQTAERLTPAVMELSGADAVVVLPRADNRRLAAALRFGLMFNSGATCIGPRRVMWIGCTERPAWVTELIDLLRAAPPVIVHRAAREAVADAVASALNDGAIDLIGKFNERELRQNGSMHAVVLTDVPARHAALDSDLFAPVLFLTPVKSEVEAIELINTSRYRLAASVFGPPRDARKLADRLAVGSVTINDLIAPTADPRLPFGGRGESGFGVTRGAEGLLAMTTTQVISTRRGRVAFHLSKPKDADTELLLGALQLKHDASILGRLAALKRLATAVTRRR